MPDRVDLYNHKIRGHRTHHTTTTTRPEIITTTTNQGVPPPVLSRPPPVTTTTTHVDKIQGYRFNYLPVDRPY